MMVMQHEVNISLYDLREMLSRLTGSTRQVDVALTDGSILESCSVVSCNGETLTVRRPPNDSRLGVPIFLVKALEFECFHKYRGLASRIFRLE